MTQGTTYRVGVDIGGTFTDIVLLASDGSFATRKVPSTTDDYSRGIVEGLAELIAELAIPPTAVEVIGHGTTVATNAIIEGKGARTALITTEGFRDVLEFRRIRVPKLYDLFYDKPAPLVPRRLRFEVAERIAATGEVLSPLSPEVVDAVLERIHSAGVEAVAVCLLNSYANPSHEHALGQALGAAFPDQYVSLSVDILPEIREYERTSTTVINAYVGPIVKQYLASLLRRLRDATVTAPLLVMQSSGGVMTAESAMLLPAHIIESGPAAGVVGAARLAKLAGYPNVITLDMGGTTAKASSIENGELVRTTEYEVGGGMSLSSELVKGSGHALKLPVIDVSEIGAGGGSIVQVDALSRLLVGPQSAGAVPGPVCYGAGGEEPTITDAHVVLGYTNPAYLAGGRVKLNAEKARRALDERIAQPLKLPLLQTAYGVHEIASTTMVRAVKAVSTYRGRDPREFVLMAFGGSGPICAVEMARSLQMKKVLIPPSPGLFSAFGLLFAGVEHQFSQTFLRTVRDLQSDELRGVYGRLEDQAASVLAQEGYGPDAIALDRLADLRYAGQAYELTVPVPGGPIGPEHAPAMMTAFEDEHFRTYGHRAGTPVELVNVRVIGRPAHTPVPKYDPWAAILAERNHPVARPKSRLAYFGPTHGEVETPVIARYELIDRPMAGPLIVEEYDTTCLIPPGCQAALDQLGNIVVDVEAVS